MGYSEAIAVDFGGTSIKIGVTRGGEIVQKAAPLPTQAYGSPEEIEGYRALRERGEPLKTLSIVGVNTDAAQEGGDSGPGAGEVILDRPVHDTGSAWYAILSFFLPIIGLIAAIVFRRHNYIRNYKACRKGVIAFAATLAVCVLVLLLFIIIAVL